jgi:hypothetical protein
MRSPTCRLPRAAFAPLAPLFVLFSTFAARPALAQPDPFAAESPPAPPPGAPATKLPGPEAEEVQAAPALPPGPVERLPATAYPEWKTRGLNGGSLWLTFHGMPWPYYPRTGIGFSGYAWVDTGYEQVDRGIPTGEAQEIKYLLQQGRAVLRATPTYSRDTWYVQGQVELVGNKDQTQSQSNGTGIVDIDDLWVRTGRWKAWDVTLGRFEGFEVYHFGMGLDLNTLERRGAYDDVRPLPDVHGVLYGQLRPPNIGNVAFHVYPGSSLRVEVLAQLGNEAGLNSVGGRPAVIYDLGWLKLKAAAHAEYQSSQANTYHEVKKVYGGTGAIQFVFDPIVEFGLNADWGFVDHWKPTATNPGQSRGDYDPAGSVTTTSFGGFANFRIVTDLLAGVGANYITEQDAYPDAVTGKDGKFTHLQAFGALQYLINKQLFIKLVGAYARAHIAQSNTTVPPWDNSMGSARVRLLYLF